MIHRISLLAAVLLFHLPGYGQERELHWRRLAVDARLDADGVLHVRELQEIVFTGDWNGGERLFRLEYGQHLKFERLLRIDPATGEERVLTKGNLDDVDEWKWAESRRLRWRSRLPSDPPFNGTAITYVLEYSISNLLVPEESGYRLDHDFVFPDRSGRIEDFTLALDIDPAWNAGRPVPVKTRRGPLEPGEGYVLNVPLKRLAAGTPASVFVGAGEGTRYGLAALLLAAVAVLAVGFFRREKALGRFEPLLPPSSIDAAWLQENVLRHPPEVVGAAWDDRTSAPEVAAILARLVSEKKIESRVERTGFGPFKRDVLHMTLKAPKSRFEDHERPLVDGLFVAGDHTSTDIVRKHYKSKGFDPAATISVPLRRRAEAILPPKAPRVRRNWPYTVALVLAAVALIVIGGLLEPAMWIVLAVSSAAIAPPYVIAMVTANRWQDCVHGLAAASLAFLVPAVLLIAATTALLVTGWFQVSAWTLGGLTLLVYTLLRTVFQMAASRDSRERLRFRKTLAAGREYFRAELGKETPALTDDWYPWLIAFGLGGHVDRWFQSFGATTGGAVTASSFRSGGSSGVSSSGWSGGGGAFGGAGASASWAAAAGSMAAGVTHSSSGSGGGGGHSGGGGGGGW